MWLTTKEAAEILKVNERTVRRWAKSGRLEARWATMPQGGKRLLVWVEAPTSILPRNAGEEGRYEFPRDVGEKGRGTDGNSMGTDRTSMGHDGTSMGTTMGHDRTFNKLLDSQNPHGMGNWGDGERGRLENSTGFSNFSDSQKKSFPMQEKSTDSETEEEGVFQLSQSEQSPIDKIWLPLSDVATLLRVTHETVRKKIHSGEYKYRTIPAKHARGGKKYLISIFSLPPDIQLKLLPPDTLKNLGFIKSKEEAMKMKPIANMISELLDAQNSKNRTERIKEIAKKYGYSQRQAYRFLKKYKEGGLKEVFKFNRERTSRYKNFYESARAMKLQNQSLTTKEIHAVLLKEFGPENSPSYRQLVRFFNNQFEKPLEDISKGGARRLRRARPKLRRDRIFNDLNEIWAGDHTQLNIRVLYNNRVRIPWITTFIDYRTRMIVGYAVSLQPSTETIVQALTMGMLEKKPAWQRLNFNPKQIRRLVAEVFGDGKALTRIMRVYEFPHFGVPQKLLVDNGMDFVSKRLMDEPIDIDDAIVAGLNLIGIERVACKPGEPWQKGMMEGWYTMLTRYLKNLPGGWDKQKARKNRDWDNIQKPNLLTLEELEILVDLFIFTYNRTRHRDEQGREFVPIQEWYDLAPVTPIKRVKPEQLFFLMKRKKKRVVHADHIAVDGYRYWDYGNVELRKLEGKTVNVLYDPNDRTRIWVFRKNKLVAEVPLRPEFAMFRGDDVGSVMEQIKHVEKVLKEEYRKIVKDAPKVSKLDALAAMVEQAPELRRSEPKYVMDVEPLDISGKKGKKTEKRKLKVWEFEEFDDPYEALEHLRKKNRREWE